MQKIHDIIIKAITAAAGIVFIISALGINEITEDAAIPWLLLAFLISGGWILLFLKANPQYSN